MNENRMSVSRALKEIKLLEKRIEDGIGQLNVAGTFIVGYEKDAEAAVKKATANLESIQAIIARRDLIKRLVIKSNAETTVSLGGVQYSVAELIERRNSIGFITKLEDRIRRSYYDNQAQYERVRAKVLQDAAAKAERMAKQDGASAPVDPENTVYKFHYDDHITKNTVNFVAVEGVEPLLVKLRKEMEEFDADVDTVLAESNATTFIDLTPKPEVATENVAAQ